MRQSGTMTPIPTSSNNNSLISNNTSQQSTKSQPTIADVKLQMHGFLQKNQINQAFQVALCAADLDLLMHLCEQCQPGTVFEQQINPQTKKSQCQLTQPVILSLIQQLSQDFTTHLELKLRYLEDAVFNLDATNPLTREHTPQVISQLIAKIHAHTNAHPTEKLARPLKMLAMASQTLLQKTTSSSQSSKLQTSSHHDIY